MKPAAILALVLGVAMFANGIIMLRDPLWWYSAVPTVPFTGPFNQHFVRDIGIMYALSGAGFVIGALRPHLQLALWSAATSFLGIHACLHVWETIVGICTPANFGRDFGPVVVPALIGMGLITWHVRSRSRQLLLA